MSQIAGCRVQITGDNLKGLEETKVYGVEYSHSNRCCIRYTVTVTVTVNTVNTVYTAVYTFVQTYRPLVR